MCKSDAFSSDGDNEDRDYTSRRRNVSESPVKSYSLAEDGLEEISEGDNEVDLPLQKSTGKRKRVILVSDDEDKVEDEAMYTAHNKVCHLFVYSSDFLFNMLNNRGKQHRKKSLKTKTGGKNAKSKVRFFLQS